MNGLGADQHYWQALREGRVEMQRCAACARWHWPAVWRCGECGSWDHVWHETTLMGRIYSWTRTWHDFGAARELGLPFVSVVVTLDGAGHQRLLGTLDATESEIRIGQTVSGHIDRVTIDGESVPALRWRIAARQA